MRGQLADDLCLELTRRNLEGVGRVTMCGFPAKDLEKYVEKLREKHDVTISRIGDSGHEHTAYTLPSIDHEAEQAINAYEAEFGADGTRVFRDPAADAPQPTVRELFDGYKLTVGNALSKDTAFVNACRNSDRQNAYLEGATLSVVLSRHLMISSLSACTLICPRSITGCIRSFWRNCIPRWQRRSHHLPIRLHRRTLTTRFWSGTTT